MIWVWVFLGIALVGLLVTIAYGVWLWHKVSDLFSEIEMLGKRGSELAALVDQVKVPERLTSSGRAASGG